MNIFTDIICIIIIKIAKPSMHADSKFCLQAVGSESRSSVDNHHPPEWASASKDVIQG